MRESQKIIIRSGPEHHYASRAMVLQVPQLGNFGIEGFEPSEQEEDQ